VSWDRRFVDPIALPGRKPTMARAWSMVVCTGRPPDLAASLAARSAESQGMSAPETLTLRPTVIAGVRYADDYQVRWRALPVGRIVFGSGAPHDRPPWSWSCTHPLGPDRGGDRPCAASRRDQRGGGGESKGRA
jgi:hypothetical protein